MSARHLYMANERVITVFESTGDTQCQGIALSSRNIVTAAVISSTTYSQAASRKSFFESMKSHAKRSATVLPHTLKLSLCRACSRDVYSLSRL